LYHLGTLQLDGLGMPRDVSAALDWYVRATLKGSGAGCLQLGILYATGEQVGKDYTAAADWYSKAPGYGIAGGSYNLAFLHFRGLGAAQDALRGLEPAGQGHSSAQPRPLCKSEYGAYLRGVLRERT
jgi:TPR repeat protein